jgi:hypothetical protein
LRIISDPVSPNSKRSLLLYFLAGCIRPKNIMRIQTPSGPVGREKTTEVYLTGYGAREAGWTKVALKPGRNFNIPTMN